MSTGRIVWHELMTNDVEKARGFYADLLGWQTEVWKPGEMDYTMISVDGQTHGGFQNLDPSMGAPSHWLAHVHVADVDAAVAKAKERGGAVVAGPMEVPKGRFAAIADPQGAVISVYTPATDVPSMEGVFLWDELLATDVEAAKGFYEAVIGWSAQPMGTGDLGTYTVFMSGESMAGGLMSKPEAAPGPAAWVTYLATDDVDATAAKAQELGGKVVQPAFDVPTVGRIAIIVDPTGAAVGLFKPEPTP